METTKLTIRIPRDVVERAKAFAGENETSVTRLISTYLSQLSLREDLLAGSPAVQRLTGILSPDISVDDYYQYLEEKYGPAPQNPD